jgi:predicted extracellular nuclease
MMWSILAALVLPLLGCPPDGTDSNTSNHTPTDMQDPTPDMAPDLPAETRKPIRVATFNLRLLFDTTCNSGRCGPNDFEAKPTQEELDARFAQIRAAITTIDADVYAFQEIETQALFEQLTEPFAQSHPVRIFGESGGAGSVDVAVMMRGQHLETRKHRNTTTLRLEGGGTQRFARELLEVHTDIEGRRVVMFAAHFVSKSSDADGDRRRAEAAAALPIILGTAQEFPAALVVLGGDLNDTPDSQTLLTLTQGGLTRVGADLPAGQFYSYNFRGQLQSIDHILFVDRDTIDIQPGSVEALHDEGRSGFGGSDHAAVRATLLMP